jgi:hypothetical protein
MDSKKSRIAELADIISVNTAKLEHFLAERNLPQPSFASDGPSNLSLSPDLEEIRNEILDANLELQELILGPTEIMAEHPVQLVDSLSFSSANQNSTTI